MVVSVVATLAAVASCAADSAEPPATGGAERRLSRLSVVPASVALTPGMVQRFSASATWSDGDDSLPSISWSATGGAIDSGGDFVAGDVSGQYRVVAEASGHADTSVIAISSADVMPPPDVPATDSGPIPDLGVNASLNGWRPFPENNAWNTPVDTAQVDPNSAVIIANMNPSATLHPDWGFPPYNSEEYGIPYVVVSGHQPKVSILYVAYGAESDPGPYPIPRDAPIEGTVSSTGDRHVIVLDRDNSLLYELNQAFPQPDGSWHANSGAIFDLRSNVLRPEGWTSADAAGLPIFPGLVRYDEVSAGEIRHALRFTTPRTRKAFVYPARHAASWITDPGFPPMGMRVRLRRDFDTSGFAPQSRIILEALKKYGMILADNGGNWMVSGVTDSRWDEGMLDDFSKVKGSDFEVVRMGQVVPVP